MGPREKQARCCVIYVLEVYIWTYFFIESKRTSIHLLPSASSLALSWWVGGRERSFFNVKTCRARINQQQEPVT